MGCCCSQEEDDRQFQEPHERTSLLGNSQPNVPVAQQRPAPPVPPSRPSGSETLAQILDRSAHAYIDVNAVDSGRTRSQSQSTKTRQYGDRLNSLVSVHSTLKSPHTLPFGVMSHASVLNEPIISRTEIETIVTTSETLNTDLENMKPRVKEPLATFLPS